MANKISKRKRERMDKAGASSKVARTVETVAPPADLASFQPKSLQTLIHEDELDITMETLATLTEYPSIMKSKACRELRGAVHEFRQACTTGVNSVCTFLSHVPPFPRCAI